MMMFSVVLLLFRCFVITLLRCLVIKKLFLSLSRQTPMIFRMKGASKAVSTPLRINPKEA